MASMTLVFYIGFLTYALSCQIFNIIEKKFTPKKSIYAGAAMFVTIVFVSSSLQSRITIIVIYGVLLGAASGITVIIT